jgi:hypothetical protein
MIRSRNLPITAQICEFRRRKHCRTREFRLVRRRQRVGSARRDQRDRFDLQLRADPQIPETRSLAHNVVLLDNRWSRRDSAAA